MISTRDLKNYYNPERRMGNSTRQADFAIQNLFKGHTVLVEDHSELESGDKHLLRMILKRLELQFMIPAKDVEVIEENKITIKLLKV